MMTMKILEYFVISFLVLLPYVNSGLTDTGSSAIKQQLSDNEGLYDANDKVIPLNGKTFTDNLIEKDYATLLEFYNSYCGHCRRFAPVYKNLANEMWPWRDIIKVMAIDCASDENNDICRKYEIMAYPTLRYFSPHYKDVDNSTNNVGADIHGQSPDNIKKFIIQSLTNETLTRTSNTINNWPNFEPLTLTNYNNTKNLFQNQPNNVQYIIIIYESEDSIIGSHLMLDFNRFKSLQILRTVSPDIAKQFNMDKLNAIAIISKTNNNVYTITVPSADVKEFQKIIRDFITVHNLHETELRKSAIILSSSEKSKSELELEIERTKAILNEVKKNKHYVYQADLENALRYTLFHEITKFTKIKGEMLLALQRFINVLVNYNPLGENGQKFLKNLREYILSHNEEIDVDQLRNELNNLEKKFSPVFSSSQWIGCRSLKSGLRGFTCGLWQLFHFLTVQAAENEKSNDPLEVLQAIYGYVKYYFGCSECSNHFQVMAAKNKIWNVSSKDNAVLWLWSAHNEVNARLKGDQTEDPDFPKIQFPSRESCSQCYKEQSTLSSVINLNENEVNLNWDRSEILSFMKRIHNPANISRFGVDNDDILPPTAEKLQQKRLLSNVFSDIDMRMGIFLYLFCIGMMIVVVKLLLRRGYRKKMYFHDILGKV